jgi:hypothetical protein
MMNEHDMLEWLERPFRSSSWIADEQHALLLEMEQ